MPKETESSQRGAPANSLVKMNVLSLSVVLFIGISPVFADNQDSVEWGATTNGVQLSIRLAGNESKIPINQQFKFLVRMKNVSTNESITYNSADWTIGNPNSFTFAPGTFSFTLISPSGKEITAVDRYGDRWFGSARNLYPGEAVEHNIESSRVCGFDEIGTYKVFAKRIFRRFNKQTKASELFLAISNPLSVSVVAEGQSTNSPSNPKQ